MSRVSLVPREFVAGSMAASVSSTRRRCGRPDAGRTAEVPATPRIRSPTRSPLRSVVLGDRAGGANGHVEARGRGRRHRRSTPRSLSASTTSETWVSRSAHVDGDVQLARCAATSASGSGAGDRRCGTGGCRRTRCRRRAGPSGGDRRGRSDGGSPRRVEHRRLRERRQRPWRDARRTSSGRRPTRSSPRRGPGRSGECPTASSAARSAMLVPRRWRRRPQTRRPPHARARASIHGGSRDRCRDVLEPRDASRRTAIHVVASPSRSVVCASRSAARGAVGPDVSAPTTPRSRRAARRGRAGRAGAAATRRSGERATCEDGARTCAVVGRHAVDARSHRFIRALSPTGLATVASSDSTTVEPDDLAHPQLGLHGDPMREDRGGDDLHVLRRDVVAAVDHGVRA